ncbi:MAG: alanine racemase [Gemmatimonadaceae bacterium]
MTRQSLRPEARAWLEIDLAALRRNAARVAAHAQLPLLPMIKADGYGLDAVAVARALESLEPWGFGVATVGEGEQLRAGGVGRPIVVFTPLGRADLEAARAARLTPTLGAVAGIADWIALGGEAWHLAVDTGMSRAGVRWDEIWTVAEYVTAHPPEGAFTHFHSAERDTRATAEQERRFAEAIAALPVRPPFLHTDNSAAAARRMQPRWELVRPGVILYGVRVGDGARIEPEPVVSLRARVVEVRTVRDGETVSYDAAWRAEGERRIATIPVGYADGYRRSLSGRGTALIDGRRVPVAGRVTMDMTMLDVTGVACRVGSVATLLGRDGDQLLTVDDVARAADLSPYELLVGLRLRLHRIHADGTA